MRRTPLIAALALALTAWIAPTATATPQAPATCTGVIKITHLAFDTATVMRGQTADAHLTARNCTNQTVATSLVWSGRFLGTTTGTVPPGCPAIDPIAKQVTFAPFGQDTDSFGSLIFPSCTATAFSVTATFNGQGGVLATATATVAIVGP